MGFVEIKEGAGKKIALSVVLLAAAIGYTFYSMGGSSSGGSSQLVFKCEKCEHVMEASPEEFTQIREEHNKEFIDQVAQENPEQAEQLRKMLENPSPDGMMGGPGMMDAGRMMPSWGNNRALTCPACGEKSLWMAIKCKNPEGCDNVFFRNEAGGDFADECPECKYSKSRERKEQRIAEKKKKIEEKRNKRKR